MKNAQLFQTFIIVLCLFFSTPSFSKEVFSHKKTSSVSGATTVTSFSPTEGYAGTQITIVGTDFANNSVVKIGTTTIPSSNVIFSSSTELKVTIPCGINSGVIEVDGVVTSDVFTYKNATISTVLPDLSYCAGTTVPSVTVSGNQSGVSFSWTNLDSNIGLNSSGNGNVATFTAKNSTNEPLSSVIEITPKLNNCPGISKSYEITINPKPIANSIADIQVCTGANVGEVALTASSPLSGSGTSFNWTSSIPIGMSQSNGSTSPIPSFTANNITNSTKTSLITVTPFYEGCEGNQMHFTIAVEPASVAGTISGAISTCYGTAPGILTLNGSVGTVVKWQSSLDNSTWNDINSTALTLSPGVLTNATYFRAVVKSGNCIEINSIPYLISINALPIINAGADQIVCQGTSLTLSGSGATTYTWNNGISNNTSFIASATTTYLLTGVDSKGCSNTDEVLVKVNPIPGSPSATAQTFLVSQNATVNDLVVSSLGSPVWYNLATAGSIYSSAAVLNTGTYYVAQKIDGCESTTRTAVAVSVFPDSVGGSVSGSTTVCKGSNSTVLTLSGNTGSVKRWQSSTVNDFSANVTDFSIINTNYVASNLTTPLYFRAVVQSGSSESFSSPAFIDISNPSKGGTLSAINSSVCKNVSGGGLILNSEEGSIVQWQESINNGGSWVAIANTSNNFNAPALSQTTQYRVEVKNGICASSFSNVVTIVVKDTPTVTDLPNQEICLGETKVFGDAFVANQTYSLTSNLGYSSTLNKSSITFNTVGKQLFTYLVTNTVSGCFVQDQFELITNPLPIAAVVSNTTICEGGAVDLGAANITGNTYSWSSNPSGYLSTNSNPNVLPAATTTYTLEEKITVTGCTKTNSVTITVQPKPIISITGAPEISICESKVNQTIIASISNLYSGYNWEVIPANGGSLTAANTLSPQFTPSAIGIANGFVIVRLNVTGQNPCNEVVSNEVKITIDKTTAELGADQIICEGPISITSTIQNAGTISWTHNGSGSILNSTKGTATPIYNPSPLDRDQFVTFSVVVTPKNGCGANAIDSVTYKINGAPSVQAGSNVTVCETQLSQVLNGSKSFTDSVVWSHNGAGTLDNPNAEDPTYTFSPTDISNGSVTFTLRGKKFGCIDVISMMTITIRKNTIADAGPAQTICQGQTVYFTGSAPNSDAVSWSKNMGSGGFYNTTTLTPNYVSDISDSGIFTFTLTAQPDAPYCNTPSVDSTTVTIVPKPIAFFDPIPDSSKIICEIGSYVVNSAHAANYESLVWTTSGDGNFIGGTTINPTYTPGTNDKSNGTVKLTLTAKKKTPCLADATAEMILTITKNPIVTVINTSSDVCTGAGAAVPISGTAVTFGVNASNYDNLTWTSSSGNTSGFLFSSPSNTNNFNSYTPLLEDIANGSVSLTLKASRLSTNCNTSNEKIITLKFIKAPQVDAGPATATICENGSYTTTSATAVEYKNLIWSSNGSPSTIANATSLNGMIYTPSAADLAIGSVTLKLTAVGNSCQPPVADNIVLNFKKLPQITIPNDTSICESSTSYPITGANVIDGGTMTWSSDGIGGSFSDIRVLNPTYYPSAQDKTRGYVNLTLTAEATAECSTPQSKSFKISFVKLPTVNAGSDINSCDLSFKVLNATATNYSAIQWTADGTGSLDMSSIDKLEAIYNPLAGQTGKVTLTLTVTPLPACLSTGTISDFMEATFIAKPTVSVIPQADICADSPNTTIIGTTITNASSYEWTSTTDTTIIDKKVLEPAIIASATDILNGFIDLTITAKPNSPCVNTVSRNVRVTIKPLATVTVTNDLTVCMIDADTNGQLDPKTLSATFTNYNLLDPTAIKWEIISGTGSITGGNTTTPIFLPAQDTDEVKIKVSVKNITPCTAVVSKEFTLKAVQKPVVTLSKTTDTVCSTALTYNLTGNTVLDPTNRVEWTRITPSGTGNFGNNATPNTTYTFNDADRANGFVELLLTAYADPLCSTLKASDKITIFINKAPTATINLSLPLTVCAGEPYTATAVNPDGNTLEWTEINGNHGTFANGNSDTATFNQAPNNSASFEIQLKSSTPGICDAKVVSQMITVQPKPTIDAGAADQYNCSSKPFVISGVTGTNYDSVLWTIDGTTISDGFDLKTDLNPTFTPTTAQITAGIVVLKVTAKAKSPCGTTFEVSDTITLHITPAQTVSFIAPTAICEGDTISLLGTAPNSSSVSWSTSSTASTSGFANSTALNTTYTPSLLDKNLGKVSLTLKGITNTNCPTASYSFEVLIKKKPTAEAGAAISICQGTVNYTVTDAYATNYDPTVPTNINWTLTGPATILSGTQNQLNPTIVPTPGASGEVVLTLTVTGYTECNSNATATKTITIVPMPVVTVPSTKTICEGQTLALTTAEVSATNSGAVSWSSSNGLGTFSPNNSLATIYTPATGQTGLVNLILTANGVGGVCSNQAKPIALTIIPKPIVEAGVNGTICQTGTFSVSGANVQNYSSYAWGVTGSATIQNGTQNSLTPIIVPNSGTSGTATVTLTAIGNGVCPVSISDNLTVEINPAPVVHAGTDDKLCQGTTSYQLNGSVTNAASGTTYVWTTNGSGTIQPNLDPLKPIYVPGGNDFNSSTGIKVIRFDLEATSTNGCAPVADFMELTIYAKPVVSAGSDITNVCEGTSVIISNATVSNSTSINWSSSGNGTFDYSSSVVNPTYTLGSADTSSVILTISAMPNSACPQVAVTDTMTILINKKPTIVASSNEITMCAETFTLPDLVTVSDVSSILWTNTTGASGSPGVVSNATTETPSFTPSAGEIVNGFVVLKLTAQPKVNCSVTPEVATTIKVILTPKAQVDAGNHIDVCQGNPIVINSGLVKNYSGYTWSHNGTGTIDPTTINSLHPKYNPGTNEVGTITFTLTASNVAPCSGTVSDTVTVTIKPNPIVDAGTDFTICSGSTASLGNATTSFSDTIVWSSSQNSNGTSASGYSGGSFLGTGINPTYIPTQSDKDLGYVYLTVKASNSSCSTFVTDVVKVTIAPGVGVSAGINGTICEDATFSLTSATSNATTVAWSSSQNSDGSSISSYQAGSFNFPSNVNPIYTPSNDDIARGYVFLTIKGTGNSTCPIDKSHIRLDIVKKPTVTATDIQMCMSTTSGVALNGTGANYSTLGWTMDNGPGYINNGEYFSNLPLNTTTSKVASLRLVATPLNGCSENAVKYITINIQALPIVEAGTNGATCYIPGQTIAPFSIIGSSVANASTSSWATSASASGKFNAGNPVIYESFSNNCTTETLTLTANGIGACSSSSVSDSVTLAVNCTPPTLGTIGGISAVCQGTTGVVYIVPVGSNVQTYNWQVPTGATIVSGQGTNSITVDYGTNAISGNISVNGVNGCGSGTSSTFTVTVNQRPTAATVSGPQTVCAGTTHTYTASTIANADSYEWILPDGSTIPTTTNTISIPFSLAAVSGNLSVRGKNVTCGIGAASANYSITVVPQPSLSNTPPANVCSNSVFNYTPTSITSGVTFTWTRGAQTGISNPVGSGTGVINETLLNITNGIVPVNYTLTLTTASGCSKTETVTVNVKPIPSLTSAVPVAAICSATVFEYEPTSDVSGSILWSRATVPGISETGTSGSTATNSKISETLTNTTLSPITVSYLLTLPTNSSGCAGPAKIINLIVNPVPNVTLPSSQVLCEGASLGVNFATTNSGGTSTFEWTNSNANIGLNSSGFGSISNFTLLNPTTTHQVAKISVVPVFTNGGISCKFIPPSFDITVNPTADVNQPTNQVKCSGEATDAIIFSTTNTTGTTTYAWTNTNSSIGLGLNGNGNIASFTAGNTTSIPQEATIVVTPTYTDGGVSCTGLPKTFKIIVNPKGNVTPPISPVVCANSIASTIFTTTNTNGTTTYAWTNTNNNTVIGLASSGTGSISPFTALNPGTAPEVANVDVIPTFTNEGKACVGTTGKFSIKVNPAAQVNSISDIIKCKGDSVTAITFSTANTVGMTTYSWTNSNATIGLGASGLGDIPTFTATNSGTIPAIAEINVTPTFTINEVGCIGTSKKITITVNPSGDMSQPLDKVVCHGEATSINFSTANTLGTTTYDWSSDLAIGMPTLSGTGTINFTASNTGNSPIKANIKVIPTFSDKGVSCKGSPKYFTITVNPSADVNQPPTPLVLCNGTQTSVNFTTNKTGGTTAYSWTNNTPSIGILATGKGSIPTFTVNNFGTAPLKAKLSVEPTFENQSKTCSGGLKNFEIIINPTAQVNQPNNQVKCNGELTTPVVFTTQNTEGTTTYTWTNDTPGIGLASSGTTDIPAFAVSNSGTSPLVATIIVTPTFTYEGVICTGPTKEFKITVNPVAHVSQPTPLILCDGVQTNVNFATANSKGVTSYSWSNTTPSIGLGVSGFDSIPTFTAKNNGNTPVVASIEVTPTFTYEGKSCPGTLSTVKTFSITVNPSGQVNLPNSEVVCNGASTTVVNFTTTDTTGATTFAWTNNNPSIGLAPSGSGTSSIPSFTAVNTTTIPQIASITVTPTYTNAGVSCAGTPKTFTITVNPSPQVNQPTTAQVICNGGWYSYNFTSVNTGGATTYSWTNSNTAIGLTAATGTGLMPSFKAVNTGLVPTDTTIEVTPTYTYGGKSCTGLPTSFTITVNPSADVVKPTNQVVCNGGSTAAVTLSSLNANGVTTYLWTNTNTSIGLPISGTGPVIPSFTAVNKGNAPIMATIVVTPTYTYLGVDCTGPSKTFTITVNPSAELNEPTPQFVCNGTGTTQVNFTSNNVGGTTTYSWTNNNTTIGLASNGTGAFLPSFGAVNSGTTPVVATIDVIPTYINDIQSCPGSNKRFTITVNPSAQVVDPIATTLCNGETSTPINFTTSNTDGNTTYTWTNTNSSIGLGLNGSGAIPSFTAINNGTSPITSNIVVTPVYSKGGQNCSGSKKPFEITVNPSSEFNQPLSQELCSGATTTAVNFTSVNTVGTTTYSWTNSNTNIGIPASGSGTVFPSYLVTNSSAIPQTATITVTAKYSNLGKICSAEKTFTIRVHPSPKATISGTNSFTVCQNEAQPTVTFSGSNGTPPYKFTYSIGTNNYTVSSSGPSNTATVSLPTVNFGNYTVKLVSVEDSSSISCVSNSINLPNEAYLKVLEQGTITPDSSSTVSQTLCQGTPIVPIVFTIGGSATNAYVTNLPAGLEYVYTAGTHKLTILGSPTATGTFNYEIHTTGSINNCNSTYGGTLTVKADDVITVLTPATAIQIGCACAPIKPIAYSLGGGATGGDVTFLPYRPNGIVWSVVSNVLTISGTSCEVGSFTYKVQSYGICDPTTFSGSIEIKEKAVITLVSGNSSPTICLGNSLGTAIQYGISSTVSATLVFSGTLPAGVSFDSVTGSFSGIPTQSGSFPYTISASTMCGNILSGIITVNPVQTITDMSANTTQVACVNSAIDPILFKVAAGVTSVVVNPALPNGLTASLNTVTGILTISGIPTVASSLPTIYTVKTQGGCGSVATATITFDIKPVATITFLTSSSTLNQSVCQNGPIAPIKFTVGGGATGIVIPTLPAGLTIDRDALGVYTISGNPSSNGTILIPITTTGCAVTEYVTISNVNSAVSINLTSAIGTDNQSLCQTVFNSPIVPIKYSILGATGVTVTGMPVGISYIYNAITGDLTFTGTPTLSGIYNYSITTLPCNVVKTGILKVSTPISITNELVTNVSCNITGRGAISVTILGGVTSGGLYAVNWSGTNGYQNNQTTITGLEPGNYTISGTDAIGCALPTKTYTVLPASPINISLLSTSNVTCNGSFGCANFNYSGGSGIYSKFLLQYLDPSSQVLSTIVPANTNYFNICELKAGLYYLTVTDSNNCTTEPYLFTINDYRTLKIDAISLDESLCENTAGKVRVTVSSLDNNLTFYYNNAIVPNTSLGNNMYELAIGVPTTPSGVIKVINSQNCWATQTVKTTLVNPQMNIASLNLSKYGNILVNENVKFTNGLTSSNIPAEYDYIVWDFGDNSPYKVFYNPENITPDSSGESLTTVFHSYAIDGLYPVTLTVYNHFGCSKSINKIITVGQGASIMLPSAFSPNLDGINDVFRPSLLGLKEVSMYIYDNWGNLIYEISSDTASLPSDWGWNGIEKVNSEPVNGTYRYFIMAKTINDKIIEKEGQFILIK